MKTILITGANSGLGKEAARQFANLEGVEKVILGCRNAEKAKTAKMELEPNTGKSIFQILLIDVSSLVSVRAAVNEIKEPLDVIVMNAGGIGGRKPESITADGVTQMMASNVLGHSLLMDELLNAKKLLGTAVYAGSEAARGVPLMGMRRPALPSSSVADFVSICKGTVYQPFDMMQVYGTVKYLGAMWIGAMARKHPEVRFITVSPGGTGGTQVMRDAPALLRFLFNSFGNSLMPFLGIMHKVEAGASRYVQAATDKSLVSGHFYASKKNKLVGKVVDQSTIFKDLSNESFQDNAYEAVHSFLK